MKKFALICALVFTAKAHAQDITPPRHPLLPDSFTINITGGGDYQATVTKNYEGDLVLLTERCSFRKLSGAEQAQSTMPLLAELADEAKAVLNGSATITEAQPTGLSGSWTSLTITYVVMRAGSRATVDNTFASPVVAISGQESDILGRLVEQAREQSRAFCR